jgi:hypothetical protein
MLGVLGGDSSEVVVTGEDAEELVEDRLSVPKSEFSGSYVINSSR